MFSPTRNAQLTAAVAFTFVVVATLAAPGGARSLGATWQARDTTPGEDLRCLTRRPGDCLDKPVPRDEPHGAICATCHNMWNPAVPANVTRSCTDAGCHSGGAGLSTFHKTVHPEALRDCLHCHKAHDFRVPDDGNECTACHTGGGRTVEWVDASSTHGLSAPVTFTHADHNPVDCVRCHGEGEGHGTLVVSTLEDCRSCHHRAPVANNCQRCHAGAALAGRVLRVTRSLEIRIGSLDRPLRLLPFDHANHLEVGCAQCHTQGTNLRAAAGADCSGCHLDHHDPDADCATCHETPARGAHDLNAHMGCAGVGCHDPVPPGIKDAPRTRNLCLACHTDMRDHKPDRTCTTCHRLPAVGGVGM